MFPLAGKNFPKSTDELCSAIHDALEEVFKLPRNNDVVACSGGTFPQVKQVKVDLSDATVSLDSPPPIPIAKGKRQTGPSVSKLEVVGQPVRYQTSKAYFELSAQEVSFDFARDQQGEPILVLTDAKSGEVEFKVGQEDLQALIKAAATMAAKQQGVTIQELKVSLKNVGPRTLEGEAHLKAKKMVMTGRVMLRGRVEIDNDLVATLSNLSCTGEGVIGTMASGLLQGRIKQLEGQKFPLTTFSLGDVRLHGLNVVTTKGLHVTAQFGRS